MKTREFAREFLFSPRGELIETEKFLEHSIFPDKMRRLL